MLAIMASRVMVKSMFARQPANAREQKRETIGRCERGPEFLAAVAALLGKIPKFSGPLRTYSKPKRGDSSLNNYINHLSID